MPAPSRHRFPHHVGFMSFWYRVDHIKTGLSLDRHQIHHRPAHGIAAHGTEGKAAAVQRCQHPAVRRLTVFILLDGICT